MSEPEPTEAAPRRLGLRALLHERFRKHWRMLRGRNTPSRLAISIAIGVFVGCLPLYGLHIWLCLALCLPLRLDSVAAGFASNISNPLVAPFLIVAEVEVGSYLRRGVAAPFDLAGARRLGIGGFLLEAGLGSLVVGSLLAALFGLLTWLIARRRTPQHSDAAS